jgi:O-antigen/teichoic acid export membrane protein
MILWPLAGFGIGAFWLQRFGQEGENAFRWVKSSLLFLVITTSFTVTAVVAWAIFVENNPQVRQLLFWLIGLLVAQAFLSTGQAALQLQGRYGYLSLLQIFPHVGRAVVTIFVYVLSWDLLRLAQGYMLIAGLTLIWCIFVLWPFCKGNSVLQGHERKPLGLYSLNINKPRILNVFGGSLPFALTSAFYLIYLQSDLIMIARYVNVESVGIYTVAFTILSACYLFPKIIYQLILLPYLHRWAHHDQDRFLSVYKLGNGIMLVAGFGVALSLVVVAPWVVPGLFGEEYTQSANLVMLLAIVVPIKFLGSNVASFLTTSRLVTTKVAIQGIAAIFNVGANVLIIPVYGVYGAAITTVLTEALLLVGFFWTVKRFVFGSSTFYGWTINPNKAGLKL